MPLNPSSLYCKHLGCGACDAGEPLSSCSAATARQELGPIYLRVSRAKPIRSTPAAPIGISLLASDRAIGDFFCTE